MTQSPYDPRQQPPNQPYQTQPYQTQPYRAQPYGQQQYGQQPYGQQGLPVPYGYAPPPMPTASPKSPGVAVILSILIPGLGHLYSGNPLSAVFWFVSAVVSTVLISVLIGFILLPLVWIGAAIHAYISTANFNSRHHVVR